MEKLYNVSEVAEMLGVSASFIYKKAESGKLESVKIGSSLRFRDDHIRQFINDRETAARKKEYTREPNIAKQIILIIYLRRSFYGVL